MSFDRDAEEARIKDIISKAILLDQCETITTACEHAAYKLRLDKDSILIYIPDDVTALNYNDYEDPRIFSVHLDAKSVKIVGGKSLVDANYMFYRDGKRVNYYDNIDLTLFHTENIEIMTGMFSQVHTYELDLSSFDTRKVRSMNKMFEFSTIGKLNISSFDTSHVLYMAEMFQGSRIYETIDFSNFRTQSLSEAQGMFAFSGGSRILNLESFDLSNAVNINYMLYHDTADDLQIIKIGDIKLRNLEYRTTKLFGEDNIGIFKSPSQELNRQFTIDTGHAPDKYYYIEQDLKRVIDIESRCRLQRMWIEKNQDSISRLIETALLIKKETGTTELDASEDGKVFGLINTDDINFKDCIKIDTLFDTNDGKLLRKNIEDPNGILGKAFIGYKSTSENCKIDTCTNGFLVVPFDLKLKRLHNKSSFAFFATNRFELSDATITKFTSEMFLINFFNFIDDITNYKVKVNNALCNMTHKNV